MKQLKSSSVKSKNFGLVLGLSLLFLLMSGIQNDANATSQK